MEEAKTTGNCPSSKHGSEDLANSRRRDSRKKQVERSSRPKYVASAGSMELALNRGRNVRVRLEQYNESTQAE